MSTTPVAVRNVILVTGYDYENPKSPFDFDKAAFERILDLFEQNEHLRYPLRFHLLSAARGLTAESVVFDRSYPRNSAIESNMRALRMGEFWLRVEQRFEPVTSAHYSIGKVFAEPRKKSSGQKSVLSIPDVYRYLYSFWEGAFHPSSKNPVAFDAILELSFFSHASVNSVCLVNSADRKPRSRERDEEDKDARAKDFTGFSPVQGVAPADFWKGIANVFDRACGRVRIWGADAGDDTRFYGELIRAVLAERERTSSGLLPRLLWDSDSIPVADPQVLYRLGKMGPTALSFGQVKAYLDEGLRSSYGAAAQKAFAVTTYQAPLGAATEPERTLAGRKSKRLLFAVRKADHDVAEFHQAVLARALDPDGRRYHALGPRHRELPEQDAATSPLAGLPLFKEQAAPFAFEVPSGRVLRDKRLQDALENALKNRLRYDLAPESHPAIAIADVSGSAPYPYAATPNDDVPYYSASLLKIAAMYAICWLREVVRKLAAKTGKPPQQTLTLDLLAPYLSSTIDRGIDFSRTAVDDGVPLAWRHRVPAYPLVFKQPPASTWDLNRDREANVNTIFDDPDGSNGAAQELIHSLGYAWINGVLRFAGFPEIWLAGDYSFGNSWPSARIPSSNDGLVAQVTTARSMAALFAIFARQDLEEAKKVREWLKLEVKDPTNLDWLGEHLRGSGFTTVGAKEGLGPLKRKKDVYSEGAIVEDTKTKRRFVVVWQNSLGEQLDTVLEVILQTLKDYAP